MSAAFSNLRDKLDTAVEAGDPDVITQQVKRALQETLKREGIALPDDFLRPRPDTYARRLLHRDPAGRYTAVVMTWGPGQGTALHDHAGMWCVECVVEGEMEVQQYDLVEQNGNHYRFAAQECIEAVKGSAGCLIPPFEYHTLANRRADRPSITLHIYGGEMDHCHVFEPEGDGSYRRVERRLAYHA